jgi:hypothetical protein
LKSQDNFLVRYLMSLGEESHILCRVIEKVKMYTANQFLCYYNLIRRYIISVVDVA